MVCRYLYKRLAFAAKAFYAKSLNKSKMKKGK